MGHLSYEDSKKRVRYGLYLLAIVTLVEVFVSLFGKGHIIPGMHDITLVVYLAGLIIVVLSLYKAYFIIYEFMHMKYEVKSLARSVLLPTTLLVWAIIAFLQEGGSWEKRRAQIRDKNAIPAQQVKDVDHDGHGMVDPAQKEDVYIPQLDS
jgi:cytochrome c oxidase subunit IV